MNAPQKIDLSTIKVLDKDRADVTSQLEIKPYSKTESGIEYGLFQIDFAQEGIKGPVTITYSTTVDTTSWGADAWVDITNHCFITKDDHRQDSSASQHIHNVEDLWKTLIKYGASWNMTGKDNITIGVGDEIPWTVVLNSEKVITGSKGQWIVDDTLPAGMLLDRASVKLVFNNHYTAPEEGTDYTITVFKGADGRTVLRIVFEKSAYQNTDGTAATITLTYKTTLDPESDFCKSNQPTKDFVNDVSFTHDGKKQDTNFTQTVTRNVVGKHGQFDSSTNLLSYTIEVNPDGSTLCEDGTGLLELYDDLSIPTGLKAPTDENGKKLDGFVSLESITVFEADRQEDGSLLATTPIGNGDLQRVNNKDSIDASHYYTYSNSDVSTIEFWTKVPDSKPLVLVVSYFIKDEVGGVKPRGPFPLNNDVTLGTQWKTHDTNNDVQFSSGSHSGLDYNADRLTVMKYSGNVNNPLAGASFKLRKFDSAKSAWTDVSSFTTDATGSKTLDSLARNTLYELTETDAPAGYLLPDPNTPYYFYITTNLKVNPIPAAEGVDANLVTVYPVEEGIYRNFTFYRNNARNPDYVKEGDLVVKKAWKNFDGSELTDESKMQHVVVTLTKHTSSVGYRVRIANTNYVFLVKPNSNFDIFTNSWDKYVTIKLEDGTVIPQTTQADDTKRHYIVPITSNCTITASETWMFDPAYGELHVNYESPSPDDVTETVDTEVGKVVLNNSNGWSYRWENLEIGDGITYTIKETSVEGYTTSYRLNGSDLTEDNAFALGKNTGSNGKGDTIVITNTAEESGDYELPSTGGAGTKLYTAGGGALMLAALMCGVCRKRRRERRAR